MDDFILPEGTRKKETMFVVPLWPVADLIYKMQKDGINLDDFRLMVPTDGDFAKFYVVHKSQVKEK